MGAESPKKRVRTEGPKGSRVEQPACNRLLAAMQEVTSFLPHTGSRLGSDPNPIAVAALGLPSLIQPPTPDPTPAPAGVQTTEAMMAPPGGSGSDGQDGGPFILSEALPVIPGKLVKKILKGEFVEMAELLKDNMELEKGNSGRERPEPEDEPQGAARLSKLATVLLCLCSHH